MHTLSYVPPVAKYMYGDTSLAANIGYVGVIRSLVQVGTSNIMLVAIAASNALSSNYPIVNINAVDIDTGNIIATHTVSGYTFAGISFLGDGTFIYQMHPTADGNATLYRIGVAKFNTATMLFEVIIANTNPYNASFLSLGYFCVPSLSRTSNGKLMVGLVGVGNNHSVLRIYEIVGNSLTQRQTILRSDFGTRTGMPYWTSNAMAHDYLFYFVYNADTFASQRVILKYNIVSGVFEAYNSTSQSYSAGRRTLKVDLADIGPDGKVYISEASTSSDGESFNRGNLRHSLLRMDVSGPTEMFGFNTGSSGHAMVTSRVRQAIHYNAALDIVFRPTNWIDNSGLQYVMLSANIYPTAPIETRQFDATRELHPFLMLRFGTVANNTYDLTAMMTRDCSKIFISNVESKGIVKFDTNLAPAEQE